MFEGYSADMHAGKFPLMSMGAKPRVLRAQTWEPEPPLAWVEILYVLLSNKKFKISNKNKIDDTPLPPKYVISGRKWGNLTKILEGLLVRFRNFGYNFSGAGDSTHVDGVPRGAFCVHRPGSEDPYWRAQIAIKHFV
jgi:hypothetical protein